MKKILSVRKEIDSLDIQIFRLLKKRFELIKKIKLIKQKNRLSVVQKKREKIQLKKLNTLFDIDKNAYRYIRKIFKFILKESKDIQKNSLR